MLVMKRFHRDAAGADWIHLVIELELARQLRHENLVRTMGIGLEAGGYFQITEFLEGMALPQLLAWARSARTRFSNAVVARILLAIIDAVKHAQSVATSESALELIRGPVTTVRSRCWASRAHTRAPMAHAPHRALSPSTCCCNST
jgi:hypothetical protein